MSAPRYHLINFTKLLLYNGYDLWMVEVRYNIKKWDDKISNIQFKSCIARSCMDYYFLLIKQKRILVFTLDPYPSKITPSHEKLHGVCLRQIIVSGTARCLSSRSTCILLCIQTASHWMSKLNWFNELKTHLN